MQNEILNTRVPKPVQHRFLLLACLMSVCIFILAWFLRVELPVLLLQPDCLNRFRSVVQCLQRATVFVHTLRSKILTAHSNFSQEIAFATNSNLGVVAQTLSVSSSANSCTHQNVSEFYVSSRVLLLGPSHSHIAQERSASSPVVYP